MDVAGPPSDFEKRLQIETLYRQGKRDFPEVAEISVEELLDLQQRGRVTLVDVRDDKERVISMIPGAVSRAAFEDDPAAHRDATVVTYCTLGYRSGLYARQLQQEGWRVFNLEGSILAWTHSGRPLADGDGPTRRVHVCGPKWSLAADGYEPVW